MGKEVPGAPSLTESLVLIRGVGVVERDKIGCFFDLFRGEAGLFPACRFP